ncbi:uncharacterized protein LOC109821400 [Asparagus officinalis]|uniref:uncharacterized protein LOC109821400 n=1 Tax=Asparagus officinalis TaxID=4686 RepID=UPI00098DE89C|nr:uncharacterized protein LOC109821400 [Asparagus officinalis]
MWIQLPGLRLNLWNAKCISKIASLIGKPIATDKLTASRQRLEYARVLVEVSVPSPLPDHISIQGPKGKNIIQKVIYELKPRWCDFCKQVGHETNYCKRKTGIQRWVPKSKVVINENKPENNLNPLDEHGIAQIKAVDKGKEIIHDSGNNGNSINDFQLERFSVHVVHDENLNKHSSSIVQSGTKLTEKEPNYMQQAHVVHVLGNGVDIQQISSKSGLLQAVHVEECAQQSETSSKQIIGSGKNVDNSWILVQGSRVKKNASPLFSSCLDIDPSVIDRRAILDEFVVNISDQQITCAIKSLDGRLDCVISSVYGFNQTKGRKELWADLIQIQEIIGNVPWLICGDFNAMIDKDDKLGGAVLSDSDTRDFNNCIEDCHLEAEARVWSRLDRALVNDQWITAYNSSYAEYLLPHFSDHSPGLISIYEDCLQGKKSFKFFKMWTKHADYLPTVSNVWESDIQGCTILLGTSVATSPPDRNIIKTGPCLTETQVRDLSKPVSKEEIKEAIFSMSDNKAPGPDGYSASFFKTAWPIIGEDILKSIGDFFRNGKILFTINSTSITLVPKVQCPKTPADFRPIACCNYLYKFISKVLANRIKSVMGYLVDEAQSAFVKGRQISSNISLAHELIKSYNRKHISPRVMLNIDIKKAFDTIS